MQPIVRFSGYLTSPNLTDTEVASALSSFLMNVQLWRSPSQLPSDWLTRDDTVLQDTSRGPVPIWGQGNDVSSVDVIGDPETPWRLLAGDGQLVIANVWLYDSQADPWPASACSACQTGVSEVVRPPVRVDRSSRTVGAVALGGAVGASFLGIPGAVAGAIVGGIMEYRSR
jgi:hypothetical protein